MADYTCLSGIYHFPGFKYFLAESALITVLPYQNRLYSRVNASSYFFKICGCAKTGRLFLFKHMGPGGNVTVHTGGSNTEGE